MSWVYKPVWVEVTGGYGYRYGLAFLYPSKPAPMTQVTQVLLGYKNINKQPISISTTTTIHRNHPPPLCHHCHQQSPPPTTFIQPWHMPMTPATTKWHCNATATRWAPAGLTPHHSDNVAHQQYLPDVPWSLTVATHTVDAVRSSNHDNDNGWEVGEEWVQPEGQQPPKSPVNWQNHSQPPSPTPTIAMSPSCTCHFDGMNNHNDTQWWYLSSSSS